MPACWRIMNASAQMVVAAARLAWKAFTEPDTAVSYSTLPEPRLLPRTGAVVLMPPATGSTPAATQYATCAHVASLNASNTFASDGNPASSTPYTDATVADVISIDAERSNWVAFAGAAPPVHSVRAVVSA